MGAKNSKVKKGEKKGAAAGDESSDQVDKTATLPASFKKKVKTACGNMWVVIMICFSCPKKNLKFISIELALSPAPIKVKKSSIIFLKCMNICFISKIFYAAHKV